MQRPFEHPAEPRQERTAGVGGLERTPGTLLGCEQSLALHLALTALVDVDATADEAAEGALIVERGAAAVEHPSVGAVVATHPVLHLELRALRQREGVDAQATLEVVGVHDLGPAVTELLFQRPTREPEHGLVDEGAAPVRPGHPEQDRRNVRESLEAAFCGGRGVARGAFVVDQPRDAREALGAAVVAAEHATHAVHPVHTLVWPDGTELGLVRAPLGDGLLDQAVEPGTVLGVHGPQVLGVGDGRRPSPVRVLVAGRPPDLPVGQIPLPPAHVRGAQGQREVLVAADLRRGSGRGLADGVIAHAHGP